ncbi:MULTISPECIES: hypothetical protein [Bacillus]|uniref:hypothetical protein n=1 Tax=Bacillus TaxID=1386 RepID=UPI000798F85B|nr:MULTISPECIES: hypothetical protein [Bacillus]KXY63025.1 endonuclease [Bacillus cereus]PFH99364.1 hypothetical protein COI64_23925 [Bacillus cereus]PFR27323.1 hypothetical protein COK22_19335 [Bacillus cereus]PFR42913.1 hypothetical protein COK27_09505 [Bacillus thuringiensis]PGL28819.1 hypothetical protein CN921_02210 [Bacillus thuringiensis]
MSRNKKNKELNKVKKYYFNEDNQPVAGIELTLPPDIGSMLGTKSDDDESNSE